MTYLILFFFEQIVASSTTIRK